LIGFDSVARSTNLDWMSLLGPNLLYMDNFCT
jgi:hypothetical protein